MIIRFKAFTIIELMAVLFIIGILIASLTPSAARMYQETRLNRRASEAAAYFRQARQLAVTEQTTYGVAVYLTLNKFELVHHTTNPTPPPDYTDVVKSDFDVEDPLTIESTSLSDGELLTFNNIGNPSKSADVALVDTYGKNRVICINAAGSISLKVGTTCN
ncbi:MAG: hypothetical protein UT11_C0029G0009 [Berkelbacteria bacterium GW2011_GWA2_38_9]|uniref:Uncharacterized protein n=1 Tax=Berkelbacteria bacterium GW2011_GWA2_38_9 TaxID=1618334 RepID=A0A0G0LMV6_9BACT|nr:MAG: hypothetical protein UT11_C0029G0009 [Berkelbacteria bacterium GW2011_GWA2_38_9]